MSPLDFGKGVYFLLAPAGLRKLGGSKSTGSTLMLWRAASATKPSNGVKS
jgi:hypothetical protein